MNLSVNSARFLSLLAALPLGLLSIFFVFYTVRLLLVTHGLQTIRTNGQGAYIGVIVFPLLALLFGWGAWRCARAFRRLR